MLGCFAAGFRNRNISALTALPPFAAWARHLHFASWTFLCSHAEVSNCPDTFLCLGVITSVSLSLDSVLGSINLLYCSLCRSLPQPPSHQHASHPPILPSLWVMLSCLCITSGVATNCLFTQTQWNQLILYLLVQEILLDLVTHCWSCSLPPSAFFLLFWAGWGGWGGGVKCRLLTEASGSHPHGWMVV